MARCAGIGGQFAVGMPPWIVVSAASGRPDIEPQISRFLRRIFLDASSPP